MFIKNEDGGVHSVADDFELPKGWTEISEEVARVTHPALFGFEAEDVAPVTKSSKKASTEK